MRNDGDLSASPHGKEFYFVGGLFALLGGFLFVSAIFTADTSIALRLARALVAIVYVSAAVQAFERLFRPERASRRTLSLPDSIRNKLRAVRTTATVLVYATVVIAAILHFSTNPKIQDLGTDALVLAGVFIFLAIFVADFCGERWPLKNFG